MNALLQPELLTQIEHNFSTRRAAKLFVFGQIFALQRICAFEKDFWDNVWQKLQIFAKDRPKNWFFILKLDRFLFSNTVSKYLEFEGNLEIYFREDLKSSRTQLVFWQMFEHF